MSAEGVEAAVSGQVQKRMFWTDFDFSNAGVCLWGAKRFGYVGWMGLGGSCMMWQPEERIGFACVRPGMMQRVIVTVGALCCVFAVF